MGVLIIALYPNSAEEINPTKLGLKREEQLASQAFP